MSHKNLRYHEGNSDRQPLPNDGQKVNGEQNGDRKAVPEATFLDMLNELLLAVWARNASFTAIGATTHRTRSVARLN